MADPFVSFNPQPDDVRRLLAVCPAYAPTPMFEVHDIASVPVLVKDETHRMRLGAFKGLGGAYAVARLIDEAWQAEGGPALKPDEFMRDDVRELAGKMTFVTASAGNHGMAVAAGARVFGAQARIYLSADVPDAFEARLREKDAEVVRSGDVYAQSVAAAAQDAADTGALLLADGSWPGYIRAPSLVMEGYTVIAEEMRESFEADGGWPSHVFLQAGVGGIACATAHMIRRNWAVQPDIIVVEPDAAPCLKASHEAGGPTQVSGPISNMGRLDCKEPSIVAFDALETAGVRYVSVPDEAAAQAADDLGGVAHYNLATTPSGAAGLAGLRHIMRQDAIARPLIIVSEGAV